MLLQNLFMRFAPSLSLKRLKNLPRGWFTLDTAVGCINAEIGNFLFIRITQSSTAESWDHCGKCEWALTADQIRRISWSQLKNDWLLIIGRASLWSFIDYLQDFRKRRTFFFPWSSASTRAVRPIPSLAFMSAPALIKSRTWQKRNRLWVGALV